MKQYTHKYDQMMVVAERHKHNPPCMEYNAPVAMLMLYFQQQAKMHESQDMMLTCAMFCLMDSSSTSSAASASGSTGSTDNVDGCTGSTQEADWVTAEWLDVCRVVCMLR